jgi:hypothetical protein
VSNDLRLPGAASELAAPDDIVAFAPRFKVLILSWLPAAFAQNASLSRDLH